MKTKDTQIEELKIGLKRLNASLNKATAGYRIIAKQLSDKNTK